MDGKQRSVGIIGAMEAEIEMYVRNSNIHAKKEWNGFTFYEADLFGREVVIAKSGVGKVFSALVCQKLITEYNPSAIIFTGVAGSLNKELVAGDIVISRDCIQHDMDATALGFKRGEIPFTGCREFAADASLRRLALSCKTDGHKLIEGRILTGDQFLTRSRSSEYSYLRDELSGDAVEMEGAAVAQVCAFNMVPFLIVRTITDDAGEGSAEDFNTQLPVVAKNSFAVVGAILQNRGERPWTG